MLIMEWLSLRLLFVALVVVYPAAALNVTTTPGMSKRCETGNDDDINVMIGFVTPEFKHKASDAWGGDKSHKSFNDFTDHLANFGEHDANRARPQYRMTGVRGRCGHRLDNIQFRYSKRGTRHADVVGTAVGGSGGNMNPPWNPTTKSQPFTDLVSDDGQDYVTSVQVNVCEAEHSDRICWIKISTKRNPNAFVCGQNNRGIVKSANNDVIKSNAARLYSVMGYSGAEVDKLQFLWVPADIW